ncbi:non-specific lipid transfer protein GPI-anchored 2 [Diospyros lotus]|uniref:non-specific lipid transfer protein GPI-anchored 2 n=1 Tax=Diospyros lotus TaxID=55363 RepID=UPI0022510A33|nr:non-specific lipid transfer protein GPI-anchored 2 [Diospyros lotus]
MLGRLPTGEGSVTLYTALNCSVFTKKSDSTAMMPAIRTTTAIIAVAAALFAAAVAQSPAPAPQSSPEAAAPQSSPAAAPEVAIPPPEGEAPGPSGSSDCLTYLSNMYDCLSYVEEGSNETKPAKACCPELAELVKSHVICLCQLLGGNISETIGIQINVTKALNLPSVCGVQTPPASYCAAFGYPVAGVPVPSEAPSPSTGGGLAPSSGINGNGASAAATAMFSGSGPCFLLGLAAIASLTTLLSF